MSGTASSASTIPDADVRPRWSASAVLHVHPMSAWWETIHGRRHRRTGRRTVGNVTYMRAPIAGYRIRHDGGAVVVEVKPSHAPAIFLARCDDAASARAILATIAAEHGRPFLGAVGRAAA